MWRKSNRDEASTPSDMLRDEMLNIDIIRVVETDPKIMRQYRKKNFDDSLIGPQKNLFDNNEVQKAGIARAVGLLSNTFKQRPKDFLALPVTCFDGRYFDTAAAFIVLASPKGLPYIPEIVEESTLYEGAVDAHIHATDSNIYQLYAGRPPHYFRRGATVLTGERPPVGTLSVMDYTPNAMHIAGSRLTVPGSEPLVFRPSLIVDSAGILY